MISRFTHAAGASVRLVRAMIVGVVCSDRPLRARFGRPYGILIILNEFSREALMMRVDRKLNSIDVLGALTRRLGLPMCTGFDLPSGPAGLRRATAARVGIGHSARPSPSMAPGSLLNGWIVSGTQDHRRSNSESRAHSNSTPIPGSSEATAQ